MPDPDEDPDLDAAHVDAAWNDILANYGERATLPGANPETTPTPEVPIVEPEPELEWWEREEHFVPPTPPPVPLPRGARGLAWFGVLGLPVIALVCVFTRYAVPGWIGTLGVLGFLASLSYLIWNMPHGDDGDPFDGNNGAIV